MRQIVVIAVVLLWLATACGGSTTTADGPGEASAPSSSSDPQEPQTTLAPGATAPPSTPTPLPSDLEARRFDVDGAVVWARTALDSLPAQATVVRVTSTLIDSGDGLELCLGGVDESLPPQCAGPVVDGLDPTGWTRTEQGVTWGSRTVTVAWPPVDGHLTLLADEPPLAFDPIDDGRPDGLPAECESIETFVHRDTISFFAADNPDRTAGGRAVDNGAVVVLMVVEQHLEEVRAELTTADAEPCLEPVRYSTTELSAAQDQLREAGLYSPTGPVLGSGSGNSLNRVTVTVTVADRTTIEAITSLYDDPGILRISGVAEILDGT